MKFRYSIENFRGLAIIFVVFSHVSFLHELGPVSRYVEFFIAYPTIFFVFISGYLFHYTQSREFNYRSYLINKSRYVILPYLILSAPVILNGILASMPDIVGISVPSYIFWSLLVGGNIVIPFWFIPMVTVFFVFAPLFNWIAKSRFLYVVIFFTLGLGVFSERPFFNLNPIYSSLHFFGIYLLGIAFSVNSAALDRIKNTPLSWVFVCVGIFIFCFAAFLYKGTKIVPHGFLHGLGIINPVQLGKLGLLLSIFFIFENLLDRKTVLLGYIAKISFGLYFVHSFFMVVLSEVIEYMQYSDPVFIMWLEVIVIVFVSFVVTHSARLVLGTRSRYVIGC